MNDPSFEFSEEDIMLTSLNPSDPSTSISHTPLSLTGSPRRQTLSPTLKPTLFRAATSSPPESNRPGFGRSNTNTFLSSALTAAKTYRANIAILRQLYTDSCTLTNSPPSSYILKNIDAPTLPLSSLLLADAGVISLARSLPDTVTNLDLSANGIHAPGAKALAKALAKTGAGHCSIQHLSLAENNINDVGAIDIIRQLKGSMVRTLTLKKNRLTDKSMAAMRGIDKDNNNEDEGLPSGENGKSPRRIVMGARGSGLSDSDESDESSPPKARFAPQPPRQGALALHLRALDLSGNKISMLGGLDLAHFLKSPKSALTSLNVGWNNLTTTGCLAIVLAVTTEKSKITVLDLSFNGVCDAGGVVIGEVLGGGVVDDKVAGAYGVQALLRGGVVTGLVELDLSRNRLEARSAQEFARLVGGTDGDSTCSLRCLKMGWNFLTTEGTLALVEAVGRSQLTVLRVENTTAAGDEGAVAAMVEMNCKCDVVCEFPERNRTKARKGEGVSKYREINPEGGVEERVYDPLQMVEMLVKGGKLGEGKLAELKLLQSGPVVKEKAPPERKRGK